MNYLLLQKILLRADIIFNLQTFFLFNTFTMSNTCSLSHLRARQSHSVIGHFYKFQEKIVWSNWKSGRSWPMTNHNFDQWLLHQVDIQKSSGKDNGTFNFLGIIWDSKRSYRVHFFRLSESLKSKILATMEPPFGPAI